MIPFEKDFDNYLERMGCERVHSGFPDFLISHKKTGVFCVELKGFKDAPRPNQIKCHAILENAGIPVQVLRPTDFQWNRRGKRGRCIEMHKKDFPEPRMTIDMLDHAWRTSKRESEMLSLIIEGLVRDYNISSTEHLGRRHMARNYTENNSEYL